MRLLLNALTKYIMGLLLVGALLFLPAGTLGYTNGWLFIGLLFAPMLFLGIVLLVKSPELLRKRLDAREKENTQKGVVALSALLFIAGFVVAGLDFRLVGRTCLCGALSQRLRYCFCPMDFMPRSCVRTRIFQGLLRCKTDKRSWTRDCIALSVTPCMP